VSIRLADDVKSLKHNRQFMEETKMLFSGAAIDKNKACFVVVFTKARFQLSEASFLYFYCCFHLLLNECEQHIARN
jgi:hypothetical protein